MRLIKDGEKGVWRWVEREIVYLSIHCRHQNDFCVKLAAMRAILMFHNCEGQSHKTVSTDHKLLKRKETESGFEPRSLCLPA